MQRTYCIPLLKVAMKLKFTYLKSVESVKYQNIYLCSTRSSNIAVLTTLSHVKLRELSWTQSIEPIGSDPWQNLRIIRIISIGSRVFWPANPRPLSHPWESFFQTRFQWLRRLNFSRIVHNRVSVPPSPRYILDAVGQQGRPARISVASQRGWNSPLKPAAGERIRRFKPRLWCPGQDLAGSRANGGSCNPVATPACSPN